MRDLITTLAILEKIDWHEQWVNSNHKEGKRLCLHGTDLSNLDLSDMNFTDAFLIDCKLDYATLTDSILVNTNLTGTSLEKVDLSTCKKVDIKELKCQKL